MNNFTVSSGLQHCSCAQLVCISTNERAQEQQDLACNSLFCKVRIDWHGTDITITERSKIAENKAIESSNISLARGNTEVLAFRIESNQEKDCVV